MFKQIKLRKKDYHKLLHSWIGVVVIIGVLGYNYFQSNKPIEAGERFEVTLEKTVDGDTAYFNINGKSQKVRFLYIDTPESTTQKEPYGKEASEYTSNALNAAGKIELELNEDGDQYDKYDRMLAWVFVDDELLQLKLVENGLVEDFYDYGYKYTYKDELTSAQEKAKENKVGIYQ